MPKPQDDLCCVESFIFFSLDASAILAISTRFGRKTASLVASHLPANTLVGGFCLCRIECPERAKRVEWAVYNFEMQFVYMIQNSYGDLYIGITDNPQQRLKYHNQNREAMFTKRASKFNIVFLEDYETLAKARKREIQIKKWRRDKKEVLIERYKSGLSTKI